MGIPITESEKKKRVKEMLVFVVLYVVTSLGSSLSSNQELNYFLEICSWVTIATFYYHTGSTP